MALTIKEVRAKLLNSSSGHPQALSHTTPRQLTPGIRVKMGLSSSLSRLIPKLLISLVAATKIREKETNQTIISFRRAINQISKRQASKGMPCHLIKGRNQTLIKLQTPANFSQKATTQANQLRPSLQTDKESKVNHRHEMRPRVLDRIPSKNNRSSNRTTRSISGIKIRMPHPRRRLKNLKNPSILHTWLLCHTTQAIQNRCTPTQLPNLPSQPKLGFLPATQTR